MLTKLSAWASWSCSQPQSQHNYFAQFIPSTILSIHYLQSGGINNRWTIVSAPKRLFLAPNGSRRFFTFLHQNYFFSAPNSFFFHTKTIFFAPNHFCKLIRFCTKFILILHQIFCKLGQNYIDFAPNISWNFSGLAPNLFRSSTKLSPISTNFFGHDEKNHK